MAVPFFHFGQSDGSSKADYFVYCGSTTKTVLPATQALPPGWADAAKTGAGSWLAFDQKNNWMSVIRRMGGEGVCWNAGLANEANLNQFLSVNDEGSSKPRVIFGPGNRYFAWSLQPLAEARGASRTIARWNSSSLEKTMKPLLTNPSTAKSTVPVQFIALGVGDSYYLKFADETKKDPVFDLAGNYAALKEYLASEPKIDFLALHPYNPNQYFLVLSNGDIRARVSKNIKDVLHPILLKDAKDTKTKVDIDTV